MPRRSNHLVCQFLENVSRAALEKHERTVREYVRGRHGVYALYRRDKLYYVGLAINLRNRLKHHLRDGHAKRWDRFSVYLTIRNDHIRELEALVLRIVRTKGNKQTGRLRGAENLKTKLARQIRSQQRDELSELLRGWKRAPAKRESAHSSKQSLGRKKTKGRQPTLAMYINQPFRIRATSGGKMVRATVRRDGSVRFNKVVYNSPSLAAAAACKRKSCNGWRFWHYQRAPGDWVPLSVLRK